MNNPFYVEPMGGYGPSIVQGLSGLGAVLGERREEKEAQEVFSSNDPNKIAEFSIRQPKYAENISSAIKFKNESTKKNMLDSMRRVLSGEDPEQVIAERAQMVQEQGGDPSDTISELEVYRQDPEGYINQVERSYALLEPEGFVAYRKATAPPEGEKLTGTQKEYQVAKREGFEGDFLEYQKALKGGPDSDVRTMMLQTQLLDLQDRISSREKVEKDLTRKDNQKSEMLISSIDSVVEEAEDAMSIAKGSYTATGIPGAITSAIPTSPSYKLRGKIKTLRANLGFDKLQQMRDLSPTGGALGQVAVQELQALQASLTNLDPNMGDEEIIKGIEKVINHYNSWKDVIEKNKETQVSRESNNNTEFSDDDIEEAAAQAGVSVEEFKQALGL